MLLLFTRRPLTPRRGVFGPRSSETVLPTLLQFRRGISTTANDAAPRTAASNTTFMITPNDNIAGT